MGAEKDGPSNWRASSRIQLKRVVSRIIETLWPKLFWRLKIRWWRRASPDWELRIAPFLCDIRKISVDAGASEGSYSVCICDHSASTIAFEPRPAEAARLRKLATAAGLRIQVEAAALSDSPGFAQLRILTRDLGRSTIESANSMEDPDGSPQTSIPVPRMRLDDYHLAEVGFIKIDVEGHELAVLRGAQNTIRAQMPNLLVEAEERHRPGCVADMSAFLTEIGYEGFFILDGEVLPLARFEKSAHQDPANIGSWREGWERRGVYVNNFFFLPEGSGAILIAALSAAGLNGGTPHKKPRS